MLKLAFCFVLAALAAVVPADAKANGVDDIFNEWLNAFNSGDTAAIKSFYGKRLGDPDAAFALDTAEDTCGFDVVRVETQSSDAMSILLAEKCFPALQRLKIELGAPNDTKLKLFDLKSFALPLKAADAAVTGMANRLAVRDKFAGSLLIERGDAKPFTQSWGVLNKAEKLPISLDTPMFLASAGKMFTAVSVLQLVDSGKIDLDAPLGRYLAKYPNAEMAKVTISQLLQHRGGTGDIGILARSEGENRKRTRTIDDIIALNGNRSPDFPPGSKEEYSNYGFALLGAVIEQVSGKSYYDYVAENIFKPAGMSNAAFPDLDHLQSVATGYTTYFGEEPSLSSNVENLPWRGTSAGGGVASANDMFKFFSALQTRKLLSAPMLRLATTTRETPWYGMGFVVNSGKNTSWGHGGNSYGMDVAAHHYPTVDTTFICMASRDMACNRLIFAWYNRVFGIVE